jgi:hypothetical protein
VTDERPKLFVNASFHGRRLHGRGY